MIIWICRYGLSRMETPENAFIFPENSDIWLLISDLSYSNTLTPITFCLSRKYLLRTCSNDILRWFFFTSRGLNFHLEAINFARTSADFLNWFLKFSDALREHLAVEHLIGQVDMTLYKLANHAKLELKCAEVQSA